MYDYMLPFHATLCLPTKLIFQTIYHILKATSRSLCLPTKLVFQIIGLYFILNYYGVVFTYQTNISNNKIELHPLGIAIVFTYQTNISNNVRGGYN